MFKTFYNRAPQKLLERCCNEGGHNMVHKRWPSGLVMVCTFITYCMYVLCC